MLRLDRGEAIPQPSSIPDAPTATPSTETQAALLIHFARGDRPISDLARAMNTS